MRIDSSEIALAERTAARVAARWRGVDKDDLTSTLYLWLAENQAALERWRGEPHGVRKLVVALRREAAKFAAAERTVGNGGVLSHSHAYTVAVIERALPFMFDEAPMSTVAEHPVSGQPLLVNSSPEAFNLAVTVLADIRGAYYGQPREVREVLAWRFRDGLTYEEIGDLSDMNKASAQKRVRRAVKRIHDALGGEF